MMNDVTLTFRVYDNFAQRCGELHRLATKCIGSGTLSVRDNARTCTTIDITRDATSTTRARVAELIASNRPFQSRVQLIENVLSKFNGDADADLLDFVTECVQSRRPYLLVVVSYDGQAAFCRAVTAAAQQRRYAVSLQASSPPPSSYIFAQHDIALLENNIALARAGSTRPGRVRGTTLPCDVLEWLLRSSHLQPENVPAGIVPLPSLGVVLFARRDAAFCVDGQLRVYPNTWYAIDLDDGFCISPDHTEAYNHLVALCAPSGATVPAELRSAFAAWRAHGGVGQLIL